MPINHNKIDVIPVLLSRRGSATQQFADGSSLSMACLTSYLKHYKDGALLNSFNIHRLINRKYGDWLAYEHLAVSINNHPSVWLFSCYAWNSEDNLTLAAKIKSLAPNSLIIVGGPHIPGFQREATEFLQKNRYIDIAVRSEGEITLAEILDTISLNQTSLHNDYSGISGITYWTAAGDIVRTADRTRTMSLDIFPSPYLSGEFEDASFDDEPNYILETNRGCPYGCTYCDWGAATLQKVRHFDLERIKDEIDYIASKKGCNTLYIADANFGAFNRDVEIAQAIADSYKKHGRPKRFQVNYAKNPSQKIVDVVQILTNAGLITQGAIALQTVDDDVLISIDRSNIKKKNMEKMLDIFKSENLPMTSEFLIGLPGQTLQSHINDMQYIFDNKLTASVHHVQMMPNAPMNEPQYREKYEIKTDKKGYIISTSAASEECIRSMAHFFKAVQFFYMIGVTKYILYYFQVEHKIKATTIINDLLSIPKNNSSYPLSDKINQKLLTKTDNARIGHYVLNWTTEDASFLFNNLEEYYSEIIRFIEDNYSIHLEDSEKNTLIEVQIAVMPSLGKTVPFETELEHDFVKYFEQIKSVVNIESLNGNFTPLKDFLPGSLKVHTLKNKMIDNLSLQGLHSPTAAGWELRSALRFIKPVIKVTNPNNNELQELG